MMLLELFYMYVNRRPLIGWHSEFDDYLGGFNVATLITRERFHYVSPEVLSLLGSVGLSLRFWHMCLC